MDWMFKNDGCGPKNIGSPDGDLPRDLHDQVFCQGRCLAKIIPLIYFPAGLLEHKPGSLNLCIKIGRFKRFGLKIQDFFTKNNLL
jgi:hypothetical protein